MSAGVPSGAAAPVATGPPAAGRPLPAFFAAAGEAEVPPGVGWLSPAESLVMSRLVVERKRRAWRLGRWVAKRAVSACLGETWRAAPPDAVEILPAPDGAPLASVLRDPPAAPAGPSVGRDPGAPPTEALARRAGALSRVTVSISHRAGMGFAVAVADLHRVGCDLELVEPRSRRFVADYLTASEREAVEGAPAALRDTVVNLVWSAKEAALKALRVGLTVDTRAVEVVVSEAVVDLRTDGRRAEPAPGSFGAGGGSPSVPAVPSWTPLAADVGGVRLTGWWRAAEGFVWTVLGEEPLRPPG